MILASICKFLLCFVLSLFFAQRWNTVCNSVLATLTCVPICAHEWLTIKKQKKLKIPQTEYNVDVSWCFASTEDITQHIHHTLLHHRKKVVLLKEQMSTRNQSWSKKMRNGFVKWFSCVEWKNKCNSSSFCVFCSKYIRKGMWWKNLRNHTGVATCCSSCLWTWERPLLIFKV